MSKEQKQDESLPDIAICEWFSYNGRRCRCTVSSSSLKKNFCNKHNILIHDYKLVDPNDTSINCCTKTKVKVVPRSKQHVVQILEQFNYETEFVDVYFPGGFVEEGSTEHDDYIELISDGTKFYYDGTDQCSEKGSRKTKNIKLSFENVCPNDPVVAVKDDVYCKECYIKISKKLGYPKLKLLQ